MISGIFKSYRNIFRLITPAQKKGALVCLGIMLTLAFMEIGAAGIVVLIAGKLTSPGDKSGLLPLAALCAIIFLAKASQP